MPNALNNKEIYIQIINAITDEQSKIVGRKLAEQMALSVPGILMSPSGYDYKGDPVHILEELVKKYSVLFGEISVGVSHDAVKKITTKISDLPTLPKILS